eukprot:13731647-Alexandrium_andersonii.AAC.1
MGIVVLAMTPLDGTADVKVKDREAQIVSHVTEVERNSFTTAVGFSDSLLERDTEAIGYLE